MPRPLKPMLVGAVHHPRLGVRVVIWYDRNNNTHYADYNGQRLKNDNMQALKNTVYKAIEAASDLVWLPLITTNEHSPFGRHDPAQFISLEVTRRWVAVVPGGRMRWVDWVMRPGFSDGRLVPEDDDRQDDAALPPAPVGMDVIQWSRDFNWDTQRHGPFSPPCSAKSMHGGDTRTRYFPYSPELWAGLMLLRRQIRQLRQNLDVLLDPADGGAVLAEIGRVGPAALGTGAAPMLPATAGSDNHDK